VEIEAKMKVDDVDEVHRRLKAAGAKAAGEHLETNTFFDTPNSALRRADKGFRLRANKDVKTGKSEYIVTFKGPRQRGDLKTRPEYEFKVDDPKMATKVFEEIGFANLLAFQKRRRSWKWLECKIELDELPHLGMFLEIEGPTAAKVMNVRKKLGMADWPIIKESYASMLAEYVKKHKIHTRLIALNSNG
jgi:adenylate cyclase class 2